MNRIDRKFHYLKENSKKALIPFVTCGELSVEETANLVVEIDKTGASIVEIGVPYSDPLADGPVIQESYCRALKNGTKLKDVFKCVELIREESEIPLVIMVYYNIVFSYGVERFLSKISEVGVDGIIVPDIPLEERHDIMEICNNEGVHLIPLVAPTSKERIKAITNESKGFVYCVSSNGTTGERSKLNDGVNEYLNTVKSLTDLPICVGFGISSRDIVNKVKNHCDGVIVGSAVVRRMFQGKDEVIEFLKELNLEL
ncbi:MAG: tryptophan synthase subunit alpha [Clostridium sp.]